MKELVRRSLPWLAGISCLFVAACDDSTAPIIPEIFATPSSIIIEVGESQTLPVTRAPSNAQFTAISDHPPVATVTQSSSSITITGVCEGFVSIVLTMPAYPVVQSDVVVEVADPNNDGGEPVLCD